MVLLVGKCLEGRRVERALFALELAADGVVRHESLAGTGGGTYEDVHSLVKRLNGVELESVESEPESLDELLAVVENAHLCNNLPTPMAKK